MLNKELLQELNEEFERTKQELGFKASFKEIDEIFFISDFILTQKFVSKEFSRQLCWRMIETITSWNNYLHGLMMPNPGNMFNMTESKLISEKEKNELMLIMAKGMEFSSRNNVIGITKDKVAEGKIIDEMVMYWNKELKEKLVKLKQRMVNEWTKKSKENNSEKSTKEKYFG